MLWGPFTIGMLMVSAPLLHHFIEPSAGLINVMHPLFLPVEVTDVWVSTAAALLVYDLMDKDSFDRVKSWVKELRKMAQKNIVMTIVANKSDMDKQRKVDLQESER